MKIMLMKISRYTVLKPISFTHPTLPWIEKTLAFSQFPFFDSTFPLLPLLLFPVSSLLFSSSLSFSSPQGDILTVTRKIDANWYEGYNGEEKGIFPITYVELLDEGG